MKPKDIIKISKKKISNWVTLEEKLIKNINGKFETHHSIKQSDYVSVIAKNSDNLFPMIKQFRHSINNYSWEFAGGLLEDGEQPETCAIRELEEEVGATTETIFHLDTLYPDSGRLSNKLHMYFANCTITKPDFKPEINTEVHFFTINEIYSMITNSEILHQPHIGILLIAVLRGFVNFEFNFKSSKH